MSVARGALFPAAAFSDTAARCHRLFDNISEYGLEGGEDAENPVAHKVRAKGYARAPWRPERRDNGASCSERTAPIPFTSLHLTT